MLEPLERHAATAADVFDRARREGFTAIARAQAVQARGVLVREGRTESTSVAVASGHGLQLVAPDGASVHGSRDDFDPAAALALYARLAGAARSADALGLQRAPLPPVEPATGREVPPAALSIESFDPAAAARRLVDLERRIADAVPGVTLRLSARAETDAWRVLRSDGGDVLWVAPRCVLAVRATVREGADRHGVGVALSSPDPRFLDDEALVARFLRRAVDAAKLTRALPDAPPFPSGSHPLVIDYALAKGLAHEAFGHAAEADGFRSSVLAREDGRFRAGDRVGPETVTVIDEPVPGDHAWQPFSANGLRRERATIVERGVLRDALTDPWTAGAAGVRVTGAARAESFRHAPLPRMTNIRIEVEGALPAGGAFEDHDADSVRALLREAGVFERHSRVAFLSGYSGGQVNPTTGDFVFNCKAIWSLTADGAALHRPAIFSGSMFGALGAVREAFGPLALDAIGTCGKWGQSVPSSGGSHWFLVLDPDPSVRLGGRS